MASRLNILVSAMLTAVPNQGGWVWAVMQYLLGLRRLGHRVFFVEPMAVAPNGETSSHGSSLAASFAQLTAEFDIGDACLWWEGTQQAIAGEFGAFEAAAAKADVFLNISGRMTNLDLVCRVPYRVYLDLDPAFTQLWHVVQGVDMRFAGHTHFATVGLAIGQPSCPVPTCGRKWITTLPPVVLERWPAAHAIERDAFTTVANWRGYGSVEHDGVRYGQKAHSIRSLIDVPRRTRVPLQLALALHPNETRDLTALCEHGWTLIDPVTVADTPARYAAFVRGSRGEWGVAKSGYVASRCGWFSDRSVCYLAAGRPVVAQETGFSRFLPTGSGLLSFRDSGEAAVALEQVAGDYETHARAARHVAEQYFDSDLVLSQLLQKIGAST